MSFQIENCLSTFIVNETMSVPDHEHFTKTEPADLAGVGTGLSTRGSGKLGSNRFNMNFLISRTARTVSSLHNNVNYAQEQPWWRRCIKTGVRPDCSKNTEKMVGCIVSPGPLPSIPLFF